MVGRPNSIVPVPSNVVLSQFYGGAYYKWSPVFGKFSVLNKKIIYFDTYMTLGGGANRLLDGVEVIDKQLKNRKLQWGDGKPVTAKLSKPMAPSVSLGLGQMFALSQDWAFNWELKWLFTFVQYEPTPSKPEGEFFVSFGYQSFFRDELLFSGGQVQMIKKYFLYLFYFVKWRLFHTFLF